jgi:hypothetical protein
MMPRDDLMDLSQRLRWLYGEDRSDEEDLMAWRRLGSGMARVRWSALQRDLHDD